jgi:hypothetical protein
MVTEDATKDGTGMVLVFLMPGLIYLISGVALYLGQFVY